MNLFVSTLPFYALSFEEFYTGVLVMPAFNGPDDAALAILVMSLITAFFGSQELWAMEVEIFGFGSIRMSQILSYFLFCYNSLTIAFNVATNLWHCRNNEHFAKRYRPMSFLAQASFMIVLCSSYLAYSLVPGSVAASTYTKTMMFAYGGQFIQVMLRLLVSSVVHDNYNPYRRTILLGWTLMAINAASLLTYGAPFINEGLLFLAICMLSWGAVFHYVYYVLQEFCSILDIWIFTIKHKKDLAPAPAEDKKEK